VHINKVGTWNCNIRNGAKGKEYLRISALAATFRPDVDKIDAEIKKI
jgi:hypothetical protein